MDSDVRAYFALIGVGGPACGPAKFLSRSVAKTRIPARLFDSVGLHFWVQAINWRSKCWNLRDHPWHQPEKKNSIRKKVHLRLQNSLKNGPKYGTAIVFQNHFKNLILR